MEGDLEALSALADPVRRSLYEVVAHAEGPIGRDAAAAEANIGRPLAAYHLDRLAASGLLQVTYGRLGGRGIGRPAKLYARAAGEFVLRAPPRDYRLLAEVLVGAAATEPALRPSIERAAGELGERLGAAGGSLEELLRERGYEPRPAGTGVLRLRNCPFESLATRCTEVVCGLNLALIRGMLRGLGGDPERAALAPKPGSCCVAIGEP